MNNYSPPRLFVPSKIWIEPLHKYHPDISGWTWVYPESGDSRATCTLSFDWKTERRTYTIVVDETDVVTHDGHLDAFVKGQIESAVERVLDMLEPQAQ